MLSGSRVDAFICTCILSISHLKKYMVLHLTKLYCNQGWFEPGLTEIDPVVLEKMKMCKNYRRTDTFTDNGQRSEKRS